MQSALVITDGVSRSRRLLPGLDELAACHLHALNDGAPKALSLALIIVDVADLSSSVVLALRALLRRIRRAAPLLMLVHDDTRQMFVQAHALRATATLMAGASNEAIRRTAARLMKLEEKVSSAAEERASDARDFIVQMFVPSPLVTPVVIDEGTDLITTAIREVGVRDLVEAVQRFDDHTHQHCLLVAGLAAAFAKALGLAERDAHHLTKAALLHDVGKIRIPTEILNKSGKLTSAELTLMRQHPQLGHAMLAGQGFSTDLLTVVRSHHELLDGSGYPDGLKGAEIPDLVRLVTICDIYAALIERRAYKPAMPGADAYKVLERMGERLDVDFVRAFHPIAKALTPASAS